MFQQFQVMQAVKVIDKTLEAFGHVGHVVGLPMTESDPVSVRLDSDGAVYDFQSTAIQGL